jgi:hypothetical protein
VTEFSELVHFLSLAPPREYVMSQMENVVSHAVVWTQKSLYMTPRAFNGVRVGACLLVDEHDAVSNGVVRVTMRVEIPVRRPAITDDRSAGFDPGICNVHQSVSGSVRNGNEKRSTGLALNTAKHPMPFNRVAPVIFALTELAFIDLDGLLGPPIFSEQLSKYTSIVSLQNWPQSAIVV